MKYNIAQVTGLNTDQKAAQVISSNQDSNLFVAALNLSCDDAFTKGRQVLSETCDYYFEAEGSPAEQITETFKSAVDKLKQSAESYDLLLATVSGKVLYFISEGKMEVYLKRSNKLSSLLGLGGSGQLISGFLQEGDKLMFATSGMLSFLGEDLVKTLDLEVSVFEDEVSSKVASADLEKGSLAGLVLELGAEEVAIPAIPEAKPSKQEEVGGKLQDSGYGLSGRAPVLSFLKKVPDLFLRYLPKSLAAIKRAFPESGRGRLILAGILIITVLAGIGFKYKNSKEQQKLLSFNQTLQKARDDFKTAQSLQGLNPQEAKAKLDLAKESVGKALSLKPENEEVLNLKKQIEDGSSSILQQFAASNFPVFLDLDLIKKGFRADKISLSDGNILLLDPETKTLVSLELAKKSNQILAGPDQLGEAKGASLNGGLAFVYSKDKGIVRIDINNQKKVTVAKKDAGMDDVADIYGFAGNVYLLDFGNQKIWKYLPTTEGYSDKREYLSKNTKGDFTNGLRMQIESSIYVLKKDGEVLRFTKGEKDNFSFSGLDKGVKDPKSFFVSSDTENLYLLDSGNSRLLVLTKTGQFKAQYQGDKFGSASDLVVDEKGKKVYLLEGSKIYSADLK